VSRWRVRVAVRASTWVEVEAETAGEAEARALEALPDGEIRLATWDVDRDQTSVARILVLAPEVERPSGAEPL